MRKIKSGLEALDFVLDSTVLNLSFIYDNYILVGAVGPFKGFFAAGFVDGHCGEVFGFELHKFFRADFFATHNIDVVDIDICCLACFLFYNIYILIVGPFEGFFAAGFADCHCAYFALFGLDEVH